MCMQFFFCGSKQNSSTGAQIYFVWSKTRYLLDFRRGQPPVKTHKCMSVFVCVPTHLWLVQYVQFINSNSFTNLKKLFHSIILWGLYGSSVHVEIRCSRLSISCLKEEKKKKDEHHKMFIHLTTFIQRHMSRAYMIKSIQRYVQCIRESA